ncbi:ABC transporter permease [Streptomyces sp. CB03911]|uniref:ABC transporter permease n=1 Tax=Streptomycetaceae TaxID=2062 RepID=UPI00093D4F61|nr:ABC transporter permease [Streptomyces sp. CB03911]OKI19623.1 ABC transporter permease [Streptomyces sp. CB03911]
MTNPTKASAESETVVSPATPDAAGAAPAKAFQGLSPRTIAWRRFRRDRTGVISALVVLFFVLVALAAPLISAIYGKDPYTLYGQDQSGLLNDYGFPIAPNGGMSGEYWFGLEPSLGRDVFTQLVYGIRTSLLIALAATVLSTAIGAAIGVAAGYLGGKFDYFVGRTIDVLMSFPSTLFFIAFMPVVFAAFYRPDESIPPWARAFVLVVVLVVFGWAGLARLLRGSVLSLREREFVEAAKVTGASPMRIIFKEIMPNLGTPILIQATLSLPALVTAEAALSFLGVGIIEPTPDWGRMIQRGTEIYGDDITYLIFPGLSMVIFVLAFNLLGDSVRDALDPKTKR